MLRGHTLRSDVSSDDLVEGISDGTSLDLTTTVFGTTLHGTFSGEDIFVNPTRTGILAKIITADVATLSLIHI